MATTNNVPSEVYISNFRMPQNTAEVIWGQILKDFESYDPDEARALLWLLNQLGYQPASGFMTREYRLMKGAANLVA